MKNKVRILHKEMSRYTRVIPFIYFLWKAAKNRAFFFFFFLMGRCDHLHYTYVLFFSGDVNIHAQIERYYYRKLSYEYIRYLSSRLNSKKKKKKLVETTVNFYS